MSKVLILRSSIKTEKTGNKRYPWKASITYFVKGEDSSRKAAVNAKTKVLAYAAVVEAAYEEAYKN